MYEENEVDLQLTDLLKTRAASVTRVGGYVNEAVDKHLDSKQSIFARKEVIHSSKSEEFFASIISFLVDNIPLDIDFLFFPLIIFTCREVKKPLTEFYYGSSLGEWEGDLNFQYHNALYEFDFSSLEMADSTFYDTLRNFQKDTLEGIGVEQKSLPLNYNLLYLFISFLSTHHVLLVGKLKNP